MDARTIKTLTGAPNKAQGIAILCKQIEQKIWMWNAREYQFAGYDRRKDLVHFTSTWSAPEGGFGHSRVGLPMQAALSNKTGQLQDAIVLH